LIFYRENCADMAITKEDFDESYIASAKALAITGTHLSHPKTREAVLTALEYAGRNNTKRLLDIDYRPVLWGLTSLGDGETRFIDSEAVTKSLQEVLHHFDVLVGTEEEFHIGDIKITPIMVDHSAFDSYMFLLDCEGKKILYTGDFRSNGRKSFEPLLRKLPKVDVLITEGTNFSNEKIGKINLTEKELEKKGIELLEGNDRPVFVLMAATNIDRIVTFYKIANATKRLFLLDTYAGLITDTVGGNIPNPRTFSNVRMFLINQNKYKILENYPKNKIGRKGIVNSNFMMCIRSSMKQYLEKYPEEFSF